MYFPLDLILRAVRKKNTKVMDRVKSHTDLHLTTGTDHNLKKWDDDLIECNFSMSVGYKQLCRFCLKKACKSIDKETMERFKALTNSTLISSPLHPKSICSLCAAKLQSASKFRISLIEMEECWTEFFRHDYYNFVKSIQIAEENIYDEIFLEIEIDTYG